MFPARLPPFATNGQVVGVVADVKHNRLYYAWLRSNGAETGTVTVSVPLVEITDRTKAELRRELRSARQTVAAAG